MGEIKTENKSGNEYVQSYANIITVNEHLQLAESALKAKKRMEM